MNTIASLLIAASAAIILLLGLIHLLYTFSGPKLLPRDSELPSEITAWGRRLVIQIAVESDSAR